MRKPTMQGQTYSVFTLPQLPYVYTIFKNGHVNVTKLTCVEDIAQACVELERALKLKPLSCRPKIDNITASGKIPLKSKEYIDLQALSERATSNVKKIAAFNEIQHVRFDVMRFPSCNIRTHNLGSLLIFSTGKFVCVGSKSILDVQLLANRLLVALLDEFGGGRSEIIRSLSTQLSLGNVPAALAAAAAEEVEEEEDYRTAAVAAATARTGGYIRKGGGKIRCKPWKNGRSGRRRWNSLRSPTVPQTPPPSPVAAAEAAGAETSSSPEPPLTPPPPPLSPPHLPPLPPQPPPTPSAARIQSRKKSTG